MAQYLSLATNTAINSLQTRYSPGTMKNMDMKPWLDQHVVPLLKAPQEELPPLTVHSEIHSPPDDPDLIVVYLFAQKDTWPRHVKRLLLKEEFYWDFMREFQPAQINGESRVLFGGDGSPFLHDNGMVSARIFTRIEGAGVILEVACDHSSKLFAQDDVKTLYRLFEEEDKLNFHDVMVKFTPPFGGQ